jgi:hypothetical protein
LLTPTAFNLKKQLIGSSTAEKKQLCFCLPMLPLILAGAAAASGRVF